MIRWGLATLFFGFLVSARPAHADDAAIEAVGGAVRAIQAHPTIEMTSERVRAKLRRDRIVVDCVFYLHNHGPATRVTVGFPCASEGDVPGATPFDEFHSSVDGKPAAIRVLPDSTKEVYADKGSWWVKEVSFEAGQTRCLRETYVAKPGTSVDLSSRSFEYILWTGSSWAGPIGVADIDVQFDEPVASGATARPEPTSRNKSHLLWHFTKIDPGPASDFARIDVNWVVKTKDD
jgi:hypothetical protein